MPNPNQVGFPETTQEESQKPDVVNTETTPQETLGEGETTPKAEELPESLKKFANEDGSIDVDKLSKSYLEQEKLYSTQANQLGDYRQRLNQYETEFQARQNANSYGNSAPYQQSPQPPNNQEYFDETTTQAINALADKRYQYNEQVRQIQMNEVSERRLASLNSYAEKYMAEMEKKDPLFADRKQAVVNEIFKDPDRLNAFNGHVHQGIPISYADIDAALEDANKTVVNRHREFHLKTLEEANHPLLEAQKQASASAVSGTKANAPGSTKPTDSRFNEEEQERLRGYVFDL